MRISLVASLLLLTATVPAAAQLSIGITIGAYPNFMAVPGYPVYYAPDVGGNYFFYDGYYWVYQDDNWYSSSWYNGPWDMVDPMYVPIYVLQVPVRYYRRPPRYFGGWQSDRAPRWNDHWGRDWAERRQDWDRPRHQGYSTPAPLPDYQRRYSGNGYPRVEQQRILQQQNYHYRPQNTEMRRDPGRQTDEVRQQPAQPNNQVQPQVRRAPQQEPQVRRAPQQEEQAQQVRRAPQQGERPPAAPRPEQSRPPAAQQPGNSPGSDHDQRQKPHEDQRGQSGKRPDKDHEKDHERD